VNERDQLAPFIHAGIPSAYWYVHQMPLARATNALELVHLPSISFRAPEIPKMAQNYDPIWEGGSLVK